MLRLINEHPKTDQFVQEQLLRRYTIKCWCGNTWEWTTQEPRSARFIADLAAEEGWTLDEDDHPRCTQCLRRFKQGRRPKDPKGLGDVQRGILGALREHGQWYPGCGWVWDTASSTKKVLDSLVRRGLVKVDEKGTYIEHT